MILANFGCGPYLKQSTDEVRWINFDNTHISSGIGNKDFKLWDISTEPSGWLQDTYVEHFDGGLLNHVLCTMNDWSAHQSLINIHRMLKPGAKLTVIDMDLLKVFTSYMEGRYEDIPIENGDPDEKLCSAISGYGTRLSLYTPFRMRNKLVEAGFREVNFLNDSVYDTRPKESLILEAIK